MRFALLFPKAISAKCSSCDCNFFEYILKCLYTYMVVSYALRNIQILNHVVPRSRNTYYILRGYELKG